ncbi:MAG: P-II family nitrogen regulator [Cyanobacteria bacterium P01_H01_bin.15]
MKRITAIIRPNRLDAVKNSLVEAGVVGITVSELRSYGLQRVSQKKYRGQEVLEEFFPRVKVEVIVDESQSALAIDKLVEAAQTGALGDGKLYVASTENAVRIRTGEAGSEAI